MLVLVANIGSTSFKFRLYEMPAEVVVAEGKIERIGGADSVVTYRGRRGNTVERTQSCPTYRDALELALSLLARPDMAGLSNIHKLAAIGFKPVHAQGTTGATAITDDVIGAMKEYSLLAPAHTDPYLEAFRIFRALAPEVPLVGVFEPGFHRTIPDVAATYGIPHEWSAKYKIRRYGFHGASHRYISQRVPQLLGRPASALKIISCHLGGSSSVCAIGEGKSIDTSMGFSPQSGVSQGTRNGDLDPFLVLYVMEREGLSPWEMATVLSTNGGLKGISGIGGDIRELEAAAAEGNERAELALEVFAYEMKRYIGAYFAVLGGLDAVAFTGGAGENAPAMRARICAGLGHLGIELDVVRNRVQHEEAIVSTEASKVSIAVVPANEELIIARETMGLLWGREGNS